METDDDFPELYRESIAAMGPPTLQVIGGGKMARVLVEGFMEAGFFAKENISICASSQSTIERWIADGYMAFTPEEFYSRTTAVGVVLVCVKPQVFLAGVKFEIMKWLHLSNPINFIVVSIMAGISLNTLYEDLKVKVIRMMPNMACGVGEGIVLLSALRTLPLVNPLTTSDERRMRLVIVMSSRLGFASEIAESVFDAAAALASSGPAFIFMAIEALADGGVLSGLGRDMALKLAANVVRGSAQLYLKTEKPLSRLKDEVCSPAGTTIAGVRQLEHAGVRSAFMEAVFASKQRAEELSQAARKSDV